MLKFKKIKLKKICAVFTAACFSVTVFGNNLFSAADLSHKASQDGYSFLSGVAKNKDIVSDKYGKVTSFKDNGSDTVVINVQDLHCDYGVQKNISSLLDELDKKYKIENIYVEGGFGNIDISLMSAIGSEYKDKILDNLLKAGRLTGAEYYAINNNKNGLLKGVENKELHSENIIRLSKILNDKSESAEFISKINREIDFLKAKYLSSENKKFNRMVSKYELGKIPQDKYFKILTDYAAENKINVDKYPNLEIYLGLSDGKTVYDNGRVKEELESAVGEIKNVVSYKEYSEILKVTNNLSDIKTLKTAVERLCEIENVKMNEKYPDLYAFLSLKDRAAGFNPLELVKEERNLVDAVRTCLAEDKTDLEVAYLSDFQKYFTGYLTSSLTSSQWEYFKLGINKFKEIYAKYSISNDIPKIDVRFFSQLDKFYEVNTCRNEIFVKNMGISPNNNEIQASDKLPSEILSAAKKIVILVAGGYHTAGVNEILNDEHVSNITVTPSVLNATGDARLNYEFNVKQQSIQNQTIGLSLLSNASHMEQIRQIIQSLFAGQNLDGINISILADQLNYVFGRDIKITNLTEEKKLKFTMPDGTEYLIDADENISEAVDEQRMTEMPSASLARLTGEKLKDIAELAAKTTFNMGKDIFAPQIYQISKEVCVFAVNNKWYLGNGAIWDIATSKYNGQILDGVEPVVYEYMPENMQKALVQKQENISKPKARFKNIMGIVRRSVLMILIAVILLVNTSCSIQNQGEPVPTTTPIVQLTEEQKQIQTITDASLGEFLVVDGQYRSLIYDMISDTEAEALTPGEIKTIKKLENLYDQALVAIYFLDSGQISKAEQVLLMINNEDGLYKSNLEAVKNTGEIVWVGIAVLKYQILTGNKQFQTLLDDVDDFLAQVKGVKVNGDPNSFGYRGAVGEYWVSTEHMLDVLAYLNLKILSSDSEEEKAQLTKEFNGSAQYLYDWFYVKDEGRFKRGYNDSFSVLDTCTWGVEVLYSIQRNNPDLYSGSALSSIDLNGLLDYAEQTFAVKKTVGDREYTLFSSGYGSDVICPEFVLQFVGAYKLLGNTEKADAIYNDLIDYFSYLGYSDVLPQADQIAKNYDADGNWTVYTAGALAAVVHRYLAVMNINPFDVQDKTYESTDLSSQIKTTNKTGFLYFQKYDGTNWRTYSISNETLDLTNVDTITIKIRLNEPVSNAKIKFQFLPDNPDSLITYSGTSVGLYDREYSFGSEDTLLVTIPIDEYKLYEYSADENGEPISNEVLKNEFFVDLEYTRLVIIAGKTAFSQRINIEQLDLSVEYVEIKYNDGSTRRFRTQNFEQWPEDENVSVPESILPETFKSLNKLIEDGKSGTYRLLAEILKLETKFSVLHPMRFIKEHKSAAGKTGAGTVVMSGFLSAIIISFITAVILLPAAPFIVPAIGAAVSFLLGYVSGMTAAHAIVDFRYLKSSGLREAVNLYHNDNVMLSEDGVIIKNVYVVNNKPSTYKDFDFKSIAVKFKSEDGQTLKGWIGKYNGARVLYVNGVNYEDIVSGFTQTRQFTASAGIKNADIDIIEIDMNNPDAAATYSDGGNPLVGINTVKTDDFVDMRKEMSLLHNKKVEAITINQSIAVFIDDDPDVVASYGDLLSSMDLYVKNEKLGVDSKILFTDKYIDKIIELIKEEVSKTAKSKEEIERLAAKKFMEIVQTAKSGNKEISVVFDSENTDLRKYFKYGIFSYVVNGRYVDAVNGTDVNAKFITSLDQIQGFDGSVSVIRVSLFKKEIDSSSGLFAFLNSAVNIKKILEKRNIEFVKQAAGNFDFDQIPQISNEVVAGILLSDGDKYSALSKYIDGAGSISVYYNSLESAGEKATFIESVLERMLAVNVLREHNILTGLKDHRLEQILAKAVLTKYKNNIDGNIRYGESFSIDDRMTVSEAEQKFLLRVSELADEAFNKNSPQAVNEIIEILPLYADRNTELRTAKVQVMDVKNIRGILTAA